MAQAPLHGRGECSCEKNQFRFIDRQRTQASPAHSLGHVTPIWRHNIRASNRWWRHCRRIYFAAAAVLREGWRASLLQRFVRWSDSRISARVKSDPQNMQCHTLQSRLAYSRQSVILTLHICSKRTFDFECLLVKFANTYQELRKVLCKWHLSCFSKIDLCISYNFFLYFWHVLLIVPMLTL